MPSPNQMPTSRTEDVSNRSGLSNPEGFSVIRDGMRPLVGYDPHDYQIEVVARVVEGQDVLALLPTGAGKTGVFVMAIHALSKMKTDPTWICDYSAISSRIPDKPAMIVIYPTNTLAEEQVTYLMHKRMGKLTTIPGRHLPESRPRHRRHQRQYDRPGAQGWIEHLV